MSTVSKLSNIKTPLPLLTLSKDGHKFQLSESTCQFIGQLKGDLAIISIAGLYRTGKSYILNRLMGKQEGFVVGPTINPCTKGIYVWGSPIEYSRPGHQPLNILLMDTEGLGSIQQSQHHDIKILSLSIILSSYFIYNSIGVIDERALDNLALVANISNHISLKIDSKLNSNASNSHTTLLEIEPPSRVLTHYFPDFMWLLRDFSLQLTDDFGQRLTATEYLERALVEQDETQNPTQSAKNKIRRTIKNIFPSRDCFTLVRPVIDEEKLQNIDSLPYKDLRTEFKSQGDSLVKKIFTSVQPKRILGQKITGLGFIHLLKTFVDAFNQGAVPSVYSAWENVLLHENQKACEEAISTWKNHMRDYCSLNPPLLPINKQHLETVHQKALGLAYLTFERRALDDATFDQEQSLISSNRISASEPGLASMREFQQKLGAEIDQLYHQVVEKNNQLGIHLAEETLNRLYKAMHDQVKSGQYVSIQALLEMWENQLRSDYLAPASAIANQVSLDLRYQQYMDFSLKSYPHLIASFVSQIEASHSRKISTLNNKQDQLLHQINELQHAYQLAKDSSHQLQIQLAQSDSECSKLNQELVLRNVKIQELEKASLIYDHQVTQVNSLQQEVKFLKDALHLEKKNCKEIQKEQTKSSLEMIEKVKQGKLLEERLNELANTKEQQTKQLLLLEEAEAHKQTLSSQLDEAEKNVRALKTKLKKNKEESENRVIKLQQALDENKDIQSQYHKLNQMHQQLASEHEVMNQSLNQAHNQFFELNALINEIANSLDVEAIVDLPSAVLAMKMRVEEKAQHVPSPEPLLAYIPHLQEDDVDYKQFHASTDHLPGIEQEDNNNDIKVETTKSRKITRSNATEQTKKVKDPSQISQSHLKSDNSTNISNRSSRTSRSRRKLISATPIEMDKEAQTNAVKADPTIMPEPSSHLPKINQQLKPFSLKWKLEDTEHSSSGNQHPISNDSDPLDNKANSQCDQPHESQSTTKSKAVKRSSAIKKTAAIVSVPAFELPPRASIKRKHSSPVNFQFGSKVNQIQEDNESYYDEDMKPIRKKPTIDCQALTKPQLKSFLTKSKIKLPPKDQPKKFYVDLYNQHFQAI